MSPCNMSTQSSADCANKIFANPIQPTSKKYLKAEVPRSLEEDTKNPLQDR